MASETAARCRDGCGTPGAACPRGAGRAGRAREAAMAARPARSGSTQARGGAEDSRIVVPLLVLRAVRI